MTACISPTPDKRKAIEAEVRNHAGSIARCLRGLREGRGWKRHQVAHLVGVRQAQITQLEDDRTATGKSLALIVRVAAILGAEVQIRFRGDGAS